MKIIKKHNVDLYELRVDYLECPKGLHELEPYAERLIITVRRAEEGGARKISEEDRLDLYRKYLKLQPSYVDVELNSEIAVRVIKTAHESGSKVILSFHDFKKTPPNLEEIVQNAQDLGADLVKIVTFARSHADSARVIALYGKFSRLIAFAMGEKGKITRIFSALAGPFTYVSLTKPAAPGQMSASELKDILSKLDG